jgi:hypothetical protein
MPQTLLPSAMALRLQSQADILIRGVFREAARAIEFLDFLNSNDISPVHFDDVFADCFAL